MTHGNNRKIGYKLIVPFYTRVNLRNICVGGRIARHALQTRAIGGMRWLSYLVMLLGPSTICGQVNLVPNGSFEELDSCPNGNSCGGLLEFATGWYEPINCTSDLAHGCAENGGCGIPQATVYPYDGVGMGLVIVYAGEGEEAREYAAIGLQSALIQDSLYEMSIRLRLTGNGQGTAVGSFGAYFASDSSTNYSVDHSLIGFDPQLQRNPDSIMGDPDIWYEWKDTLLAMGGEKFMIIGNFLNDANTPFYQPSWNPGSAYFIDDVRLTKVSKPNSVKEIDVRFELSPNPVTDLISISYTGNLQPEELHLLTIDGRTVSSGPFRNRIDVSGLVNGVYLLLVEFTNGAVGTQRVVVAR